MANRSALHAVVFGILVAGCSSGKEMGMEGGPCYGNGTCNSGLACLSALCVRPAGADAATTGLDASRALPDGGTNVSPDVAASAPPDVGASVAPDTATSVPPDAVATVAPDAASIVTPDAASNVTPDVATSVTPDLATNGPPDLATSMPPDAAPIVTPDLAPIVTPDLAPIGPPDLAPSVTPDVPTTQTGSLTYDVNCEGDGCGKTGVIRATVKACGPEGTTVASDWQAGVTLSAGTPVRGAIGQLAPGELCLKVYLDVDASGSRTPGDVVSSQDEIPVVVVSGQDATVPFGLGFVVPGGTGAVGSITYNIGCQGDACGKAGELIVTAEACGATGTAVASHRQSGVTLLPGTPVNGQFEQVAPGSLCLKAYLDVDGSGSRTPGDVVPSQNEMPVTVVSDQDASVSFDLAAVVPGGTGRVTVGWTVNGGYKCPINGVFEDTGMVQLTVAGVSGQPTRCSEFAASLTVVSGSNLPITIALTDFDHPGETATVTGSVTVVADQVASFGPVDINCSFCPP